METTMYELYKLPDEKIIQFGKELSHYRDENNLLDGIRINLIVDQITQPTTKNLARMNIIVLIEKFKSQLNSVVKTIY